MNHIEYFHSFEIFLCFERCFRKEVQEFKEFKFFQSTGDNFIIFIIVTKTDYNFWLSKLDYTFLKIQLFI